MRTLLEDVLKEDLSSNNNKMVSLITQLTDTFLENKNEMSISYIKEKLVREDLDKDQITIRDELLSDIISTLINWL